MAAYSSAIFMGIPDHIVFVQNKGSMFNNQEHTVN
jgi:hypothetical protein